MKYRFTAFTVLLVLNVTVFAQSVQELLTVKQPDCRDVLVNASNVLPTFYLQKSFDSIGVAIGVVQQYCSMEPGEIFYLKLLLSIQQSTFSINRFSDNPNFSSIINTKRYGLPVPLLDVVYPGRLYYSFGN